MALHVSCGVRARTCNSRLNELACFGVILLGLTFSANAFRDEDPSSKSSDASLAVAQQFDASPALSPTDRSNGAQSPDVKTNDAMLAKKKVTFANGTKTHDSVPREYFARLTSERKGRAEVERAQARHADRLRQLQEDLCSVFRRRSRSICEIVVQEQAPKPESLKDKRDEHFWSQVEEASMQDILRLLLRPCARIVEVPQDLGDIDVEKCFEVCIDIFKPFPWASKDYMLDCAKGLDEVRGDACNTERGAAGYLGIAFDDDLEPDECAVCYTQRKGTPCKKDFPKRQASTPPGERKTCCQVMSCPQHKGSSFGREAVYQAEKLAGCNTPRGAAHYRGTCAECFSQAVPEPKGTLERVFSSSTCPKGYESMSKEDKDGAKPGQRVLCCRRLVLNKA